MADLKDSLIETETYEDCPGCKSAYLSRKGARAPNKQLIYLGLLVLCNALPISSLYPFLYFMVKDFHIAKSDDDIGYYAGFVGSSFMFGRFLTAVAWGRVADKYGRRPVMFAGVISVIIFNTLFGLSKTFWMALLSRFLLGTFNGMLGPVKAYASEICSEEHQALGVAVVGTTWGFGLIVGPALGGYLAQPAIKYPKLFKNTILDRFPYLLPSLCITAFAIVALVIAFDMPETLHKHEKSGMSYGTPEEKVSLRKDNIDDEVEKGSAVDEPERLQHRTNGTMSKPLWRNWPLLASTLVYCIWSLHDIAYTEIFSLWAVSPKSHGGLSFTSSDVGNVLAASGFSMLVFQLAIFPPLANFLGPILTTRLSSALSIPLVAAYSYISRLDNFWLWVTTLTGSFLLINNSVTQDQRGAANGLSLSIVSLFKAIGPAGGGSIFAWAQTRKDAFILPGDEIVFFFLNVFGFLTVLATFEPFLPRSTNKLKTNMPSMVQRSQSLDRHH
ncbi:hypothetical protein O6H91_11G005500 [Diphasiastrum complanatum]|uniref:Uncharacterized protein n=2 Tax=Diphasiastrum complanatum TaxID=34168 RepID=A0ACC2C604_DIPCM|nr:hypothetical protein O6H91_11G005500 [Diphasiastrum complanatum]KAJ7537430.1 hypothetical protein O6H91_11G005500 [Diphasiastrum complanatum]